jgi:GT2 family glycosyltransferase
MHGASMRIEGDERMRTGMNAAIAGTSSFDPTAKPTTLPMLLNQIQALACELRASTDCVADKKWVYFLVKFLLLNPQVAGVGGKIVHIERNGMEKIFGSELGIKNVINEGTSYLVTANVAYRMTAIKEIGLFDTKFFSGGDVDLSWRMTKKGYNIAVEPQALVYHFSRETPLSFVKQYYRYGKGHALLLPKHLDKPTVQESKGSELAVLKAFTGGVTKGVSSNRKREPRRFLVSFFGMISIFAFTLGLIKGFKVSRQAIKNKALH